MKVFVYRNLKKKMWSLRDTVTRRVVGYSHCEYLKDVSFKVSESGRKRVVASGHKNVHAGVEGYRMSLEEIKELSKTHPLLEEATYNPKLYTSFVDKKTKEPIHNASFCVMSGGLVFYIP